ncbi:MAG: hypothetical protein ACOYL7_18135, partial [Caldilinea sp.]
MALEEVAAQPLGQGAPGQFLQECFRALRGEIALLDAQAGAHAVGQGGFAGVGRERDDAVAVSPGGDRLARLDLLGPAVAEQAQHEHAQFVRHGARGLDSLAPSTQVRSLPRGERPRFADLT